MAVFKCKLCGGTIEPKETGIGICDSCGTKQTIPKFGDDRVNSFLDRANSLRNAGEFDKAIEIYDKLLDNNEKEDPELYWNITLARYGVKYEKDPTSGEYIPTVNRLQYTSILQDVDYLKALELADSIQKDVYKQQAEAIDKIQQEILHLSKSEEPYDIFICYKETDENGKRTQDSLYAYKLYEKLHGEGFKVFFARVSLEDKIGKYEPYIFAALHSAKVMLVIGTKKEYFDAVWVKNEWSRYLQLLKDKSIKRHIVPCYKDMDPYDLPEELAYLQAQDMNKVGFEEDLLRGIKKIVKPAKVVEIDESGSTEVNRLLKRIKTYLDDGKFIEADQYCEKALDIDAENADVYFYKLLAQKGCKNVEDMLAKQVRVSDDDPNYLKMQKYGKGKYEEKIKDINANSLLDEAKKLIDSGNGQAAIEILNDKIFENGKIDVKDTINLAKNAIFNSALDQSNNGLFEEAIKTLTLIPDYQNVKEEIDNITNKINIKKEEDKKKKANNKKMLTVACFAVLIFICVKFINTIQKNNYEKLKNEDMLRWQRETSGYSDYKIREFEKTIDSARKHYDNFGDETINNQGYLYLDDDLRHANNEIPYKVWKIEDKKLLNDSIKRYKRSGRELIACRLEIIKDETNYKSYIKLAATNLKYSKMARYGNIVAATDNADDAYDRLVKANSIVPYKEWTNDEKSVCQKLYDSYIDVGLTKSAEKVKTIMQD